MKHLALPLLLSALAVHPAMAAVVNATPATLNSAIATARAGDTIVLADGDYGVFTLFDRAFSDPLKIAARGTGAKFSGMDLRRVQGLTLTGLEFAAECGSGKNPVVAAGSRNLRFDRLRIHGDQNCWSGMLIRESSEVAVTNSEFRSVVVGLSRLHTSNFTATGNRFRGMFSDGINGGCGSNIVISRNDFADFQPHDGAHPDAIQLWSTNCTEPSADILISENRYVRGKGGTETVAQGVFVTRGPNDPRLSRVRIVKNLMIGGMYNGVYLEGADDSDIVGNTVAGFPDMVSWIRAQNVQDVRIEDNRAQDYQYPYGTSGMKMKSNKSLGAAKDRGAALMNEFLAGLR